MKKFRDFLEENELSFKKGEKIVHRSSFGEEIGTIISILKNGEDIKVYFENSNRLITFKKSSYGTNWKKV